ncbi:MAG: hypothetical protein IJL98_05575 [Lachnospiraceae bacterium]|nr:hypothetical protein [Lachnospiraceae bacterium]
MKFPNAYEGVKKIYTAEILGLIGTALALLALFFGLIFVTAADTKADTAAFASLGGFAIFALAGSILGIIAFIMNIVGINRAKLDEDEFTKALMYVILGILASVISAVFSKNVIINGIADTFSKVCDLLATVFIIYGIISLSNRLNNPQMAEFGRKNLVLIVAVTLLSVILDIVSTIFQGKGMQNVYAVLGILAGIASIVQYIIYLTLLSRAKKMLAQ